MRHVKLFEDFSASTSLTEDQIKWLDSCTTGSWNINPSTGLIDVDYNFHCAQQNLTDFKGVAFGHVSGYFYCGNNQLTSLVGAPQTVGVSFYCNDNQLTSLEGAPQTVRGDFYCRNNQVSEETLSSIFALMKKGNSYQQALEEYWPNMDNEDRVLMYKDLKGLTPDEIRSYQALATVVRIKNYL
jgi:hypothetical protein